MSSFPSFVVEQFAPWARPASKPVLNRDGVHQKDAAGKSRWTPVVSFASKLIRDRWSNAVIEALRASHPEVLYD